MDLTKYCETCKSHRWCGRSCGMAKNGLVIGLGAAPDPVSQPSVTRQARPQPKPSARQADVSASAEVEKRADKIAAVTKKPAVARRAPASPEKPTPAEIQAAVDEIGAKAAAPAHKATATREGKKSFTVWLDEDMAQKLKIAAAKHKKTQEAIVAEGIDIMLNARYRP
jgi:hypothetical protein